MAQVFATLSVRKFLLCERGFDFPQVFHRRSTTTKLWSYQFDSTLRYSITSIDRLSRGAAGVSCPWVRAQSQGSVLIDSAVVTCIPIYIYMFARKTQFRLKTRVLLSLFEQRFKLSVTRTIELMSVLTLTPGLYGVTVHLFARRSEI